MALLFAEVAVQISRSNSSEAASKAAIEEAGQDGYHG